MSRTTTLKDKTRKANNTARTLSPKDREVQPGVAQGRKNSISRRSATPKSRDITYIDPNTGKKVFVRREYPEVFQNGFFQAVGKLPFSPAQMEFIIRNTYEINVFLDGWNKLYNKIINVLDSDDYRFSLEDQDEIEECIKKVLIRRYCR